MLGRQHDRDDPPEGVQHEAHRDDDQDGGPVRGLRDPGDRTGLARLTFGRRPTFTGERDRQCKDADEGVDDPLGDPSDPGELDQTRMFVDELLDLDPSRPRRTDAAVADAVCDISLLLHG